MIKALVTRFVGLDAHKRIIVACILDALGRVILRLQFECTQEALLAFAHRHLTAQDKVVVESTTNTWAVVSLLRPLVAEVVVSSPYRTKAIAWAKIKTDKVDAYVLAQLLRLDFLPRVWEPSAEALELRRRTGRRSGLVAGRTALKNRIHAVLHQRIIPEPEGKCFTPEGLAWLKKVKLDEEGREALDSELRLLDNTHNEPYRYAQPALTQVKLSRLRLRGGGPALPRGHKKGTKLPTFGTGRRTKTIPALAQVYAKEQLPVAKTPDTVSAGERRVLNEMGVAGFVQEIQTARTKIVKEGSSKEAQ